MRSRPIAGSGLLILATVVALLAVAPAALARKAPSQATRAKHVAASLASKRYRTRAAGAIEALARGGMTVRNGKHVYRRAVKPASGFQALHLEALNMALEPVGSPRHGRVSLAQLGTLWNRWHVFKRRGRDPGVAMRTFLRAWVLGARHHPTRPTAFTPLLLEALALRQHPAVDLAKGKYSPKTLRLGFLELELIDAGLDRAIPHGKRYRHHITSRHAKRRAAAAAGGPCGQLLEDIGKVIPGFDAVESSAFSTLGQEAIAQAIAGLAGGAASVKELNKAGIGNALSLINTLMRLQKLAALYGSVELYVDVPTTPIEQPEPQQNYVAGQLPFSYGEFQARVGLKPDAEKDYREMSASDRTLRKALQECAALAGIPVPTGGADFAEDLDKFRVHWKLDAATDRVNWDLPGGRYPARTQWIAPGRRLAPLTRVDDTLAYHPMFVRLLPQQYNWSRAPERYVKKSTDADATAELETAKPPDLGTLINAMLGGAGNVFALTDAIAELSAGWFQSLDTPSASDTLEVTYHVPKCLAGLAAAVRAHAAADVCQNRYTGTFSGTIDYGPPVPAPLDIKASWNGTITFDPVPANPAAPDDSSYQVTSGSFHYKATGTSNGCTLNADGTIALPTIDSGYPGSLQTFAGSPRSYVLSVGMPLMATVPGTYSNCADPNRNGPFTWYPGAGVPALIATGAPNNPPHLPIPASGQLVGSAQTQFSPATGNFPQTFSWSLDPG